MAISDREELSRLLSAATDRAVKMNRCVQALNQGKTIDFKVPSNDYTPMLELGDLLQISSINLEGQRAGDIVMARLGQDLVFYKIHKVRHQTDAIMLDVSKGSGRDTVTQVKATSVVGKVVSLTRKGKTVSFRSPIREFFRKVTDSFTAGA